MSAINWTPGPLNSILIKTENAVPNNPENRAKIKYNDPISLAFVDKNQRSNHRLIDEFNVLCDCAYLSSWSWMINTHRNAHLLHKDYGGIEPQT